MPEETSDDDSVEFLEDEDSAPKSRRRSDRETYNVISDTFVGLNFRKNDNLFQAVFIGISVAILTPIGAILALIFGGIDVPWWGGGLIGAFAGLVLGLFASGIVLMIYRARQHLKGDHE